LITTVTVPATSANLGPGFDALGLAVRLRNKVTIKPSRFFTFSIIGEGSNSVKLKRNNIFINIFNDFYRNLSNNKRQKFSFRFYNNIPLSRGLGSSSAVIVSAIAAAYECANVDISKKKLLDLALTYESHPDNITPAVMGGFTVSTVENKKVLSMKKEMPSYLKALVVIPDKPISTNLARQALPNRYNRDDVAFNISKSSMLTAAFFNEEWDLLRAVSKDRVHQYYRMKNLPELFNVQKIALKEGALMSTLSGSGSTFFSMVQENRAKYIENVLKREFPNFFVKTFDFDNQGLVIS
jgi:homoserine kinase